MIKRTLISRTAIFGMAAVGAATLLLVVLDPGIGAAAPLPSGACCNKFLGCCGPEGSCREVTSGDCNGIADEFQGSSTTCAGFCATTTTLPAFGACCLSNGNCFTDEPDVCAVNEGIYQGDGSTCETSECPIATTTTTSSSTSTLPTVFLCGDADDDKDITATDALIALKVSVGTAKCVPQRCDYNGNGMVQTSDALLILKFSVGQAVEPNCPEGV